MVNLPVWWLLTQAVLEKKPFNEELLLFRTTLETEKDFQYPL